MSGRRPLGVTLSERADKEYWQTRRRDGHDGAGQQGWGIIVGARSNDNGRNDIQNTTIHPWKTAAPPLPVPLPLPLPSASPIPPPQLPPPIPTRPQLLETRPSPQQHHCRFCAVLSHFLTLFAALSSRPSSTKRLYKVKHQHSTRVPIAACAPTTDRSTAVVASIQLDQSSYVVVRYLYNDCVRPPGLYPNTTVHTRSMPNMYTYVRLGRSSVQHDDRKRANKSNTHKKH